MGVLEVEKNFHHLVALVVWTWGLRVAILGLLVVVALLLEFEVFGVELTRIGMIRSRGCAVEWTGENVCHVWCGCLSYSGMPRMIGGLLGFHLIHQESSGAGQSSGW